MHCFRKQLQQLETLMQPKLLVTALLLESVTHTAESENGR